MASQAKKKPPALKIKVGGDHDAVQLIAAVKKESAVKQQAFLNSIDNPPEHIKKEFGPAFLSELQKTAHEMFPGDGSLQVVAKQPTLETITNPASGHVFTVVGRSKEGLRVSLRFWNRVSHPKASVGFRLRIGDQDPIGAKKYQFIENVRAFMIDRFPQYTHSFTATPIKVGEKSVYPHVSIEGAMEFNCPSSDKNTLVATLVTSPFVEELEAAISLFADSYTMDRKALGMLVTKAVLDLYKDSVPPVAPAPTLEYKLGSKSYRLMTSDKEAKLTQKQTLAKAGL